MEFGQIHVGSFDDTIQPSRPLSSPSLVFTLSQPQGLFQGVFSSHEMAKVLEPQLQYRYRYQQRYVLSNKILLEGSKGTKHMFHNSLSSLLF